MNGQKVLNRLLQLFILVNIILLIINSSKNIQAYVLSPERVDNINAILESRGLILDTKLPLVFTPKESGKLLNIEITSELRENTVRKVLGSSMEDIVISREGDIKSGKEESRIYTKGNESLTFTRSEITYSNQSVADQNDHLTLKKAKKMCKNFLKKLGYGALYNEKFIDIIESEKGIELIYYAKFKGIPVFDDYIRFTLRDGGVKEAFIHRVNLTSNKETKIKKKMTPIDMVLFGIEQKLPIQCSEESPLFIKEIKLGYKALSKEGMNTLGEEIVPVYKISIDGLKEALFVNAYTNKCMK